MNAYSDYSQMDDEIVEVHWFDHFDQTSSAMPIDMVRARLKEGSIAQMSSYGIMEDCGDWVMLHQTICDDKESDGEGVAILCIHKGAIINIAVAKLG
jgi:hypothetical protein